MSFERIFWPLLCALLAFHWVTSRDRSTVVVAYYGAQPGQRADEVRYAGDIATQTVRSFSATLGPSTLTDCMVLDARNWTCPGPSISDLGGLSSISAADGEVSVSNTKVLIAPESWFMWKSARLLGPIAKLWGAT